MDQNKCITVFARDEMVSVRQLLKAIFLILGSHLKIQVSVL